MLACYLGKEDLVESLLSKNNIDITRSTLHGGRNALFFTILSDKNDTKTKERILGHLVNKINDLYKGSRIKEYISELLYTPDDSGKNLFDHMMDGGEYSLYTTHYKECSKDWQKKIAEKYIAKQGIFNIVLNLGSQEHIEVIDVLLEMVSASFIRERFENYLDGKENIGYRGGFVKVDGNKEEQLSKLKQLTKLTQGMKKEMIGILKRYGLSIKKVNDAEDELSSLLNNVWDSEKRLGASNQQSQIEKRKKVFSHNLTAKEIFSPDLSELKLLKSAIVSKGGTFPNWIDTGRDRLEGWGSRPKKNQSIKEYLTRLRPGIDKFIDLSNISLEDSQIQELTKFLKTNMEINAFDLSCNNLSSKGVVELINALIESEREAFSLDLSDNDIGSYSSQSRAIVLLAKLIRNNKVVHLIINDIGMIARDYSKIFGALKKNTSIEKLDLSKNPIPEGFREGTANKIAYVLHHHSKLISLNLSETGITDSVIKNVVEAIKEYRTESKSNIKELDIGENEITEEGMDSLVEFVPQFRKLESLKLYDNFIGNGVERLVDVLKGTSISTLDLSRTSLLVDERNTEGVTGAMVKLVSESKVSTLNLLGNSLDEKVIKGIFVAISNRQEKVLKELNLSHNFIQMDSDLWSKISGRLGNNNPLEFLSLSDMDITDDGLIKVVNALKGSNVQGLNIANYDGIDQTTVKAVSELLESSKLRFLNIADCNECAETRLPLEVEGLFKALEKNRSLMYLDISGYHLNDESIGIISKYLNSNINLQYLSLAHSRLESKNSIKVLFQRLKSNNKLQYLDIRGIPTTNEVADEIIEYAKGENRVTAIKLRESDGLYCKIR